MKWKMILMLLLSVMVLGSTQAQTKKKKNKKKIVVTGYVMDVANRPIEGAAVLADNSKSNVFTNKKGFFKIKVRKDAKTLMALSPGRGGIEVPFTGRDFINFVFFSTKTPASQIVSVEYADEFFKKNPKVITEEVFYGYNYSTIYELIAARFPGVVVRNNNITIRGPSSINDQHNPLFVIDGVETYDIDHISPANVKSIKVLNSSEATLYGSRGGMGVIIIDTMVK